MRTAATLPAAPACPLPACPLISLAAHQNPPPPSAHTCPLCRRRVLSALPQLFFGLVIIFTQRAQELPALDDISGVSDKSSAAAAVALLLSILTLLPYPASSIPVDAPNPFF